MPSTSPISPCLHQIYCPFPQVINYIPLILILVHSVLGTSQTLFYFFREDIILAPILPLFSWVPFWKSHSMPGVLITACTLEYQCLDPPSAIPVIATFLFPIATPSSTLKVLKPVLLTIGFKKHWSLWTNVLALTIGFPPWSHKIKPSHFGPWPVVDSYIAACAWIIVLKTELKAKQPCCLPFMCHLPCAVERTSPRSDLVPHIFDF